MYVRKWRLSCQQQGWAAHTITVNRVIKFLVWLKDTLNLGIKSVMAARAAIGNYATMVDVNNKDITADVLISKLIQGMKNLTPPLRTYHHIWDPEQVLQYLRSLPPNEELTLYQLSCKTAMLAALVTGSRCQSVHYITKSKMQITHGTCYCCKVPPILKTSKWDGKDHVLHLPKFEDTRVCVFTAVCDYLDRTAALRPPNCDKLFIISRRPFTAAAGSTISGWIKTCMTQAGIDTSVYTTHSTRKASTSKADVSVPLVTILRAAGWASGHTFAQYYKLPMLNHMDFAAAVLNPVNQSPHFNAQ